VDDRVARVEVDRRSREREGVHLLGVQRRVDRREPAALAVAHEVDLAPDVVDAALHEGQVVLDPGVPRLVGRADPVERERALQPGGADHLHLALRRREVDDAGVVTGLRRQHERRHHVGLRALREVAQARDGALEHDLVGGVPARVAHGAWQLRSTAPRRP